jgi:4-amino-4-deoxy-L-arabinose transferase-like glycosyltransferase
MLLAVSPYFAVVGQISLLDQGFTFFINATLFAFVLGQRQARGAAAGRNYMLAAWAALALAVLSKGVVAIALIGATLAVYAAATRSLAFLWRMHWGAGVPLFAIIAVPWFLAAQHAHPQFAHFFFIHEHLQRFLTTIHDRVEPWWYFLPILLFAWIPVIWSARAAVVTNWKSDAVPAELQTGKLLLIWCAVVLLFFSLSQSKLAPYILPMMPALAVLFGRVVCIRPRSAERAVAVVVPLICFAGMGMMFYGFNEAQAINPVLAGWSCAAIVLALLGAGTSRWLGTAARMPQASPITWVALAVTSIAGFQALYGAYNHLPRTRSARDLARIVSASVAPGTTLFSVGHYRQSMGFYLGRTLDVFDYRGELEFGLTLAEGANGKDMAAFRRRWESTSDGVAFIEPKSWPRLLAAGMPGRVIGSDARSVAVSRR